ncbi:hypothetical protein D9M71_685220 [compost metagenome]
MRLDLVIGIGRIKRLVTHIEDFFLGLLHQCRVVRHFNVILFRDGRQLIVGLGMVGDHHIGKGFDIGRLAFLQGQSTGFDFGDAARSGLVDKVIIGCREGRAHAGTQGDGQGDMAQVKSFHWFFSTQFSWAIELIVIVWRSRRGRRFYRI